MTYSEARSPTIKVTFDDSNTQKFDFYEPQKQVRSSTALQYEHKLKPFTPMNFKNTNSNLKGAL